jgi:hypothetical protein
MCGRGALKNQIRRDARQQTGRVLTREEKKMAEETTTTVETPVADEQKIMCFVSKKMVPMSQTVEVEYMPHKKVRVLPQYIKFEEAEAAAAKRG